MTNARPPALSAALLAAAAVSLVAACANTDREMSVCEPRAFKCVGSTALTCLSDGSGWTVSEDCALTDQICLDGKGCSVCQPGSLLCKGLDIVRCAADGKSFDKTPVKTCSMEKREVCFKAECEDACKLAAENRSYVGCEYWAVDLDNAVVSVGSAAAQQFAVALSNPSPLTATVKVMINEAEVGKPPKLKQWIERTVKPNALEVVLLPSREVDGSPPGQYNAGSGTAVTNNAYRIVSDAPIIAYQFNPLSNAGVFSNDASLLVPTPALTTDPTNQAGAGYLVMSWPQTIATTTDNRTNFGLDLRAFLTIVGTREKTNVSVKLSTDIIGDGAGLVPAKKKGETLTFKLEPYQVLNLETGGFMADFTGTRIDTDKPVVVFSGSEASDVPTFADLTTRRCCADHLEHQLFPRTTLGTTFIGLTTPSRTRALKDAGAVISPKTETEYFRILTSGESTAVSTNLSPPLKQFTMGSGSVLTIKVDRDFTIQTTEPVVLGQFVAGQDETGIPSNLPGGDPSYILLPPVEQFRKDYLFLTPDKYAYDFILVAAPKGATVSLDGRKLMDKSWVKRPGTTEACDEKRGRRLCCTLEEVGAVRPAGATSDTVYDAYKCQLSFPKVDNDKIPPDNLQPGIQNDGVHRLQSDRKVGLVVYGFDAFVSYGYPGGTDLALINLK